ncbi:MULTISPECIES: bacteriohemerythrin [Calditerrivibrio]|uniref:bacteriohemerythrin n=1 Tax=Calditerrivibrio TaxID=545865 RepID=UPI003C707BE0
MKIEWKDELSVGNTQIDEQHKTLINITNKFHNAMLNGEGNEAILDVLKFLDLYVKIHFRTEEKFMEQTNYPFLEEHKQQHKDMIDFVENMKRTFVRNRDDYENVLKLNIKLMKWYLDHIGNSDKKLGDYLQDKSIKVVVVDDNVNN